MTLEMVRTDQLPHRRQRRQELLVRVDVGAKPDGTRERQRFTYSTLKEARREYRRITTEVAEGRYAPRTTITVGEYLKNWLDGRRDVRRVTLEATRNALKPVTRRLGNLPLQKLTKQHLDDLVDWRLTEERSGHKPLAKPPPPSSNSRAATRTASDLRK
ncbi:hypothetical protein [Nocardia thraciensis]